MKSYNGHRNWNYWNVSLWIKNDEGLYNNATFLRNHYRKAKGFGDPLDHAARAFVHALAAGGVTKTPDGARYTLAAVKAAMRNM